MQSTVRQSGKPPEHRLSPQSRGPHLNFVFKLTMLTLETFWCFAVKTVRSYLQWFCHNTLALQSTDRQHLMTIAKLWNAITWHRPTARLGCCWCLQVHIATHTTTTRTTTPSTVPSTTYISWFSATFSAASVAVVPAAWFDEVGWRVDGDHTWRRSWDRSKSLSLSPSRSLRSI